MEEPGVATAEWDEGSFRLLDVVTTCSNVGACWDAPVGADELAKLDVEAPTFGARVEDDS